MLAMKATGLPSRGSCAEGKGFPFDLSLMWLYDK